LFLSVFSPCLRLVKISGDKLTTSHYANIAIGSFSKPCFVHPDFRIIIHVSSSARLFPVKLSLPSVVPATLCALCLLLLQLQLPLSSVNKTSLPFLNRLEKYTLSLKVVLEARLAAIPRPMSGREDVVRPCDDPELWVAVREGVENFAEAMVAPIALPGFVPEETIAALVLRAMSDSQAHPDGAVVVRPAVHAASSITVIATSSSAASVAGRSAVRLPPEPLLDRSDWDDIDEDSNDDVVQAAAEATADELAAAPAVFSIPRRDLRAIIRLLNFQLIQLARPESICTGAGTGRHITQDQLMLPKPYLSEYVQRQDHFSAANLMRAQVAAHWALSPSQSGGRLTVSAAKLVIFTRTGTGVARLGMNDDALLALVQSGAADAARRAGADPSTVPRVSPAAVCTIQLRSVSSGDEVSDRINAFIKSTLPLSKERVLLILADMSGVTQQQVNYARQQVDIGIGRAKASYGVTFVPPLVLLLAHCPPESMLGSFPYHAVPVGGWDFVFCDAVSLGDASSGPTDVKGSTDPRRWVAAAFGLVCLPSTSESRAEFLELFDDALSKVRSAAASSTISTSFIIRASDQR
jgi:hypothetical protein